MNFLRHPISARVINSIGFYGGWTALLVYAAAGEPGKGLYILFGLLVIHFLFSHQRLKDLLFLTSVTVAGCCLDIGYLAGGVIAFASPNPFLAWAPPLWMIGVYLLFACAVDYSLFWMRNHLFIAGLCGAAGAITSYAAGARLGAAQLLLPDSQSLIIIGIVWFFFMPATCWYSNWLDTLKPDK